MKENKVTGAGAKGTSSDNPVSKIKNQQSGPTRQIGLDLPDGGTLSGPVECLGMEFPDDNARRDYFLEKLAEKLKDPEFRKIEGFPIGKDEDILKLSDPPYYTACPNPWLADFVKHYGRPYTPMDKYHKEPFAADVSEGKNDPLYNIHSYHTKVPPKAIAKYLGHYTNPDDIVLDFFAGSGMTGIASQTMPKADVAFARRSIIHIELSPIATAIANGYNSIFHCNQDAFRQAVEEILERVENEVGYLYQTKHKDGTPGKIIYTIWSDVFICSNCGDEVVFWDAAVDQDQQRINSIFTCHSCGAALSKKKMEHSVRTVFDPAIGGTRSGNKQVPVLILYSSQKGRFFKTPDSADLTLLANLEQDRPTHWFPANRMMNTPAEVTKWGDKWRAGTSNFSYVHELYTRRNLHVLGAMWAQIEKWPDNSIRKLLRFTFTATSMRHSLMNTFRFNVSFPSNVTLGTLYIASLAKENNYFDQFRNKAIRRIVPFLTSSPARRICTSTQSATDLSNIPDCCIDYIFVDPPFGENLAYAELNFSWEGWLKVFTNTKQEAIISKTQEKDANEYRSLMVISFAEAFRVLKPGRWMTVEFSNTRAQIWNAIQSALQEAGFVIANVSVLDKKTGSFNAVTTPTAVKQDLVISAYKPNGGLEDRFSKKAETEDGVWEFIKNHLGNLPIIRPRGGQLEPIAERDPRILYDRTVAFYVRHGIPVPLSSPEFQAGLADNFPERDGMYFLFEQVAEYDKTRMKMEGIGQLSIFVEDERSAANWLRSYLKKKPSKYQDIQPEFFEQLNQSWKKWETRPELRTLLDQYFLCYYGEGDVPSQIHSHLSTNFKELRNLPSDNAMLKAKARDRWYVPDPKNQVQVEQLREKRLLEEFWTYLPPGYEAAARKNTPQQSLPGMNQPTAKIPKGKRLAIVRTEAVRVGFNYCFGRNDYDTIIAVAQYVPNDVIENDEQLQMIYDSAATRLGIDE